jgi:hypothetical protein
MPFGTPCPLVNCSRRHRRPHRLNRQNFLLTQANRYPILPRQQKHSSAHLNTLSRSSPHLTAFVRPERIGRLSLDMTIRSVWLSVVCPKHPVSP